MTGVMAPAWALAAEAIDGVGDTHLPAGLHVRCLPSPLLGLPATPLLVTRQVLTLVQLRELWRSDGVIWMDSQGNLRTPPFDVTADNAVYGYFPVPNVIFAQLDGTPAQIPIILPFPPVVVGPDNSALPNAGGVAPPIHLPTRTAPFRFEALAPTELGSAPFQSRASAPYILVAGSLPMVRVVGTGTINGIHWLDLSRLKPSDNERPWEWWSLPVDPAPRYTPTADARVEADKRVGRAAATHQPLYVAFNAASAASAPAATPADALKRVQQVRGDLDRWLKTILNDLSVPSWQVSEQHAISGVSGTASVPLEPFTLGGAVDPDIGHYLGFGDVDTTSGATAGSIVLYRVRGLWRWAPKRWNAAQATSFTGALRPDLAAVVKQFPELNAAKLVPKMPGAYVDLFALAATMVGLAPDRPPVPALDPPGDRGWLATPPPPNVRRALRLQASGFRPHAVAALAASDSGGLRSLHPYPGGRGRVGFGLAAPPGTPLPLVVSRPQDATVGGLGRFEDRDAPAGAVTYKLAQGDWFGSWSDFVAATAAAKPRTPPMRPTLEIFVTPPAIVTPMQTGPLSAVITLRIPIPNTQDLPAGGAALARLDLVETFGAQPPVTTGFTLAALAGASILHDPISGHDLLVINRTGPALARSASGKVSFTARWIDALNLVSANADPAARTLTDPRPPPPPPVITELRYTARPDAQGHARADLAFPSVPGTRYRVFASTETTLLKVLDQSGTAAAAAAAASIRAAAQGAPRAVAFKAAKALFGWDCFECLTDQPLVASAATTAFTHRLSASLDVLAIYRILGEGPSGALSEMTDADLIPFAVPNLGGPSQPHIALLNAGFDPTTQGVRLAVKVPAGKAQPVAWRLRRSSVPVGDPLAMNLVAQGAVSGATTIDDATAFEIDAIEPLKAWRRYRFAVQVQSGPPPGAPTVGIIPTGEWSEASAAVPLAVVPPAAPAGPSAVSIANDGAILRITMTHPAADSLLATSMGAFTFECWRVDPGQRAVQRALLFNRGAGATWLATDTSGAGATGTYVTLRLIDPVGRRSDAVISNQLA